MSSKNTHPISAADGDLLQRLEPASLVEDRAAHHLLETTNLKDLSPPSVSSGSSPASTLSMNADKQSQLPVSARRKKDEEVLCWQRRTTTTRPRASSTDKSSSTTPKTAGIIRATSRRKKSTSMNRKIAKVGASAKKNSKEAIFLHDSEASLGDFSRHNEMYWQRKDREEHQEPSFNTSDPISSTTGSSCNLNDQSARCANLLANNSISSTSLNSESGSSMMSSTSSMSADKPPLAKSSRRTHAARTVELRKQMRDLHRMEHHVKLSNASPQKQKSAPRIMVPSTTNGDVARHPPTRTRSQSQILTSPIKRTRSLQRKLSLDRSVVDRQVMSTAFEADESPVGQSQQQLKRTSSRGPAMRNILRNRRKLELELNQNDIFRYVLHKGTSDPRPQKPNSNRSFESSSNTVSAASRGVQSFAQQSYSTGIAASVSSTSTTSTAKMPLDQFLKMKKQSEMLVQIQKHHDRRLQPSNKVSNSKSSQPLSSHTPQEVEETWHESHSLDNFFSNHGSSSTSLKLNDSHPFGMVRPVLGQSLFQLDQQSHTEQQDNSIIDDEAYLDSAAATQTVNLTQHLDENEEHHDSLDSFISNDWKDLPTAWKNDTVVETENAGLSLHKRQQSQGLTLLLDDARMLDAADDLKSLQDSMEGISLDQDASIVTDAEMIVKDRIMTDQASGRQSIYSGPISAISNLPHGIGRLEFSDTGEVFLGRFLHGWWSGYGTCTNQRTHDEYTGFFLDYCRNGQGTTKFHDGRVFEGFYSAGVMVQGKMIFVDGSMYVGGFKDEARDGRGTYTFDSGAVFTGKFRNDQLVSGVLMFPNGTRFAGRWKDGVRHGPGREFRPDGTISREGTWQRGCFHARIEGAPSR